MTEPNPPVVGTDGVTYNSTKEAVRLAGDSKVRKQRKLEKEILNHD